MRVSFFSSSQERDLSTENEISSIFEGIWSLALAQFEAVNKIKKSQGKKPSLGLQATINDLVEANFLDAGWDGADGRFTKNNIWVRISFRHSMSQGTDFFDAQRQLQVEGVNHVYLLYAHQKLLREISPGDGGSLCSYERATLLYSDLSNMTDSSRISIGRLDI